MLASGWVESRRTSSLPVYPVAPNTPTRNPNPSPSLSQKKKPAGAWLPAARVRSPPPLDRPLGGRGDVPRPGSPVRGGEGATPRIEDGRGGEDAPRADRCLLRARDHGDRDPRHAFRGGGHLLHVDPGGGGAGAGGRLPGGAGGRPEHARQQRAPPVGDRGPEGPLFAQAGRPVGGGLRAVRGRGRR